MITDAVVNAMLDNQFPSGSGNLLLSAHTAYSSTGANLTGTKTSANFAAASSRIKGLAATTTITIGSGVTVSWLGVWDSTGATFKGMFPNQGSDYTFQLDVATNNRVYVEGNTFVNGDNVVFHNGTAPTGLTTGTAYFVVGATAADPDYFQVALTSGGAAIDITGQHSSGCVVSKVVNEVFASAGNLNITSLSIGL
jgi:hypothetical protein